MVTMTTLYTFPFPSTAVFTPTTLLPVKQSKVPLNGTAYDKWIRYRKVWSMWKHEKFKVDIEEVNP